MEISDGIKNNQNAWRINVTERENDGSSGGLYPNMKKIIE